MHSRPDYKLKISIDSDKPISDELFCELYLPDRVTDHIKLVFKFLNQDKRFDPPFEFSVYGELKDFKGNLQATIKAKKVYFKKSETIHWGPDFSEETRFIGEPFDLEVTQLFDPKNDSPTKSGTFWLTPSILLSPLGGVQRSYTGEAKLKKVKNINFTLPSGTQLAFENHYRYLDGNEEDVISFPELVAVFTDVPKELDIDSVLNELDDFLMLTSFAARQRCVCLGWQQEYTSKFVKKYRRNISIPEENNKHNFNNTLIDVSDFENFIAVVSESFGLASRKDLLRQAIYRLIGRKGNVETKFLSLYSGLETLVLMHCDSEETDQIVLHTEWEKIKKDIRSFIKNHQFLSGKNNSTKRKYMYEKLPELNRISFSSAFESFCSHFEVELDGLWPVTDRSEGVSLSNIRNKLIHGDSFTPPQEQALITAAEHLKWVLERSILAVLKWPISESNVCGSLLEKYKIYNEWNIKRKILSEVETHQRDETA